MTTTSLSQITLNEMRHLTRKNIREALFSRVEYNNTARSQGKLSDLDMKDDIKIEEDYVKRLVAKLESEVFNNTNSDEKYKAQTRKILFNFKNKKNDLWHRFLRSEIKTKDLANMDTNDMASSDQIKQRELEKKEEMAKIVKAQEDFVNQQKKNKKTKMTHKGIMEIEQEKEDPSMHGELKWIFFNFKVLSKVSFLRSSSYSLPSAN